MSDSDKPISYLGLALDHLPNAEQRQAIETIDGPVLVVAGPGTGKTQLLSLRVANILRQCDVRPHNILCLTFTSAGAVAMTKRLTQLIGREALGVEVATFHSFSVRLAEAYSEYFSRSKLDAALSDLQAKKLISKLLLSLSVNDPLHQKPRDGVPGNLGAILSLISTIKKSSLAPGQLRALVEQNLAFFDYVEKEASFLELIDDALRGGKDKYRKLDALPDTVSQIVAGAPSELTTPVVQTPGVYLPYAHYLNSLFQDAELYDADGKTAGFADLRSRLFTSASPATSVTRTFKDRRRCECLLSACQVFEDYQAYLKNQGFYDYDDMILDAISALESSEEFRATLQEQYRYVLVDEFQDTNGTQMRLLDLLMGEMEKGTRRETASPNILVVGDDDQAIYRFQGASVEYLNEFERHYQGTKRIVLNTNYRSTPALVKLGSTIAHQIENRSAASALDKRLVAHRGESEQLIYHAHAYPNSDLQYFEVARAIRERIDSGFFETSGHPGEEIAVIARNHRSLRALIPYLKHFGVPYNYEISTSVAHIESLQTLLTLMRFVAAYAAGYFAHAEAFLPALLAAPEFRLKPSTYFSFALEARKKHLGWLELLREHPNQQLRDFFAWLEQAAHAAIGGSVRKVICDLAKPLLSYYGQRVDDDPFGVVEFNYGVRALLDFVEDELRARRGAGNTTDGEGAGGNSAAGVSIGGSSAGSGSAGSGSAGSGSAGSGMNRPLRLIDVVTLLDEAQRFGTDINVTIPVGRPKAITLTTAHGSKGLEYDLVYLVDADDATWHKGKVGTSYLSQNMLFSEAGDIDDDRRLLFVAATRARRYLEVSYSAAELVRELIGEVQPVDVEPSLAMLITQSGHHWEDSYYPDDPDLIALTEPLYARLKMSASFLNSFVACQNALDTEGSDGGVFFREKILRLPSEPSAALEFGVLVHSFMEEAIAAEHRLDELLASYHREIAWLDFDDTEIAHMHQRLDQIAAALLPELPTLLELSSGAKTLHTELWVNALVDNIPLTGKCDLLVCDEAARTIKIFDYKTGNPDNADFGTGYQRQLQFYKLLIESSLEFEGWTVLGGADIFVEPSRRQPGKIATPQFFSVDNEQLEHLRLLISAVWHRVNKRLFDVSAFRESSHMAALRASCVYKSNSSGHRAGDPKEPNLTDIQPIFERWLIDEWQRQT